MRAFLCLLVLGIGPVGTVVAQDRAIESLLNRPEVARYLEYFTGAGRERMGRWLTRGNPYRQLIQSKLDSVGLPSEFGSLPLIESGFSNTAVSRAGAVGMWQFIPETAREYGLRVDRWVDERRDPYRATDAAIRHILDLNRTFGEPLLAAAAYNGGTGRVSRSLERLRRTGSDSSDGPDFFSLAARGMLPQETSNYVPQFLAAAAIAGNPEAYGFQVDSADAIATDSVRIERPISLEAANRVLGLDRQTLTKLNPQFIRGVTPPGGSWLRVPVGYGDSLVARLTDLPAVVLARHESRPRKVGTLVRVRKGDTVQSLAEHHKVDEDELRRVNALPKWYRLRPGQALRLPGS